jgi:membrane protein YdbS with pleckstrin-like domain
VTHPRNLLRDNEEIVLDLRPHWWYFVRETVALGLALLVGLLALVLGWPDWIRLLSGVAILVTLGWATYSYLQWSRTHLILTTDRLIYRSGVLTRTGIEIPLERINTVFFRQTLLERTIGSGDLTIESAGEMGRQEFSNILRPLNVQNEIYHQMENNENRKFSKIGQPAAGPSIPEQIAQLDDLRQKGILSEDEFRRKKEELLGRM